MMRGVRFWWLVGGSGIVVLVFLLAGLFWRGDERKQIAEVIPVQPDLGGRPVVLHQRLLAAERRAHEGPARSAALGELARLYHANGFFDEARQCYRGLMVMESSNPRWPYLLGSILGGFGQIDEALPLLRRVVTLAPDYLPARLRLGDALLKANQPDEAMAAYQPVLAQQPGNPYALLGLARCEIALERWPAARDRLRQAGVDNPTFQAIWTLLAQVEERSGDAAGASRARARAQNLQRFREAPDPWVDGLIDDCFDPYQLRVAAAVASEAGDVGTEIRLLTRAMDIEPDDAGGNRQLGAAYLKKKEYANARHCLEKAVEVAPDDSENWVQLVALFKIIGDRPGYERALAAGLVRCPNSPTLHIERGRRLKAANQWEEALADFQLAQRLRPNQADAFVEAAGVYFQRNRLDDGMAEMRKALVAEPDNPAALVLMARYAISTGDRRGADDILGRMRQQGRVQAPDLAELSAAYRKQFGVAAP